jgi:SAM-dependent methyltransferase
MGPMPEAGDSQPISEECSERSGNPSSKSEAVPLLIETASKLKPGQALDLACGTGRNAIWLAEHGWKVTAVDRTPITIPAVDTHIADLEKHQFLIAEASWDLIVVSLYLQRDLFEPIKRGLKPGGVALVIVLLAEPGHQQSRFSVQPGELAKYFEGWEILHYYEGKSTHHRAVAEIVATKP